MVTPWIAALAPEGGWLVAALSVAALESISAFHERVGATLDAVRESPGGLLPGPWEARRRIAREVGIPLAAEAMKSLTQWGGRLGVEPPPRAGAPSPRS
jgi:LDH2 family malate/lactate/ureidoglycolate dehydrogenase